MEETKFTMFAGKAVALAEVFKFTIGKDPFVGPTICRLELSAPTEESTDGGRLAVQHVSIVPENGGPATVMATVYQVGRRAEARPYEFVADIYRKRFHSTAFPISPGQFEEMTRKLKEFFLQFGFSFAIEARVSGATPPPPTRHPTAGALTPAPPSKRVTAGGMATHTASREVARDEEGTRPAGRARLWLLLAAVALAAALVSGTVVYLMR